MKNLILFLMSTFPGSLDRRNVFRTSDGDLIDDCISQLEPVVKWMLRCFPDDELEMVSLCTEKTLTEGKDEYRSAYDFFCHRICLDQGTICGDSVELKKEEEAKNSSYKTKVMMRCSADQRLHFIEVPIDEDNMIPALCDAVDLIRDWKKETGEEGHLWIDTHGGLRDQSSAINSVISLLEVDGIRSDEIRILGVKFSQNRGKEPDVIVDQKEAYDMLEFVSGMNDFFHFGRAELLVRYYQKYPSQEADSILKALRKVSEGTQFCDAVLYKEGLDELGDALPALEETNSILLSMFSDYFKRNFGRLLDPDSRTDLEIIKWALDNKLYQQTLTMIESYMPDELYRKGIFRFVSRDGLLPKAVFEGYIYRNCQISTLQRPRRGRNCDKIAYFVEWIQEKETENPFRQNTENDECFLPGRDRERMELSVKIRQRGREVTMSRNVELTTDLPMDDEIRKKAGLLFWMHQMIKDIRNKFNHSNPDRPPMDKIIELMNEYVRYAQELYLIVDSAGM